MNDSRSNDGMTAAVAVALVLVLGLVLFVGGGAVILWQRQSGLAVARIERAAAEADLARVQAARAQALAAEQLGPTRKEQPMPKQAEAITSAVKAVLESQQQAWNAGDLELFMEGYWNSEELSFSSGGTVTRGWQATLANFNKRYPTRRDMGTLSFQNLEVTHLGEEAALVLGEWYLQREPDKMNGKFSLVFRRLDDRWVIVHDHTSRDPAE